MSSWVISMRPVTRHWRTLAVVGILLGLVANRWGPARPPRVLGAASSVIYQVPTVHKWVALTFDDGPSAKFTPRILQLLQHYHDQATFFVLGQNVRQYPQLVQEEIKQGDEVGNHTWSHVNLAHQSAARIVEQLSQTQNVIRQASGRAPTLMRPPYGALRQNLPGLAAKLGLQVVLWSPQGDTRDWTNPGVNVIVRQALTSLNPGDIILFHDGGGNRSQTVAALGIILKDLQARGYRAVTVRDLLGGRSPVALRH